MLGGTMLACWKGALVWCVCLEEYLFSGTKLTVLLGVLSFLGTTTILWHHLVGLPLGTRSMTPIASSRSNCFFTAACQCSGMGMGEWDATGTASSCRCMWTGAPCMLGSGWHSHAQKALAA